MSKEFLECAKIINTHGCRGDVKLESWCNTPQILAAMKNVYLKNGDEYTKLKVKKAAVFKQFVIASLEGIDDMDKAMEMKGIILYAKRADFKLKKGEYFIADIIGLDVIHIDTQEKLGTLKEVINRGSSDLYVVDTALGERMVPVVDEFIKSVDVNKGIFVKPIEGMFD
ncbi:MAG: 16S rRNA processing protein RimM [Clostridia bacterium]|nr:16S rRNA processing protein RimM [Clostridia bacterium]